jgi:hypothetical protein
MNPRLRHQRLRATLIALSIGLGCLQIAAAADPPAGQAPAATNAPAKEVTAEEAKKWAAELQRVVRVQDVDTFNQLFDWDAFVAKATAIPGNSPELNKFRKSFRQGLKSASVSPKAGFAHLIMAAVEAAGDYRPLRIHREDGHERALFRLISSNGALNYHDYVLDRSTQGNVVATDVYIFLIGELYSQNLRRSFLPLAHQSGAARLENLVGADKDFVAHLSEFNQMSRYVKEKNWRQAMNTYKALPASVRESKTALMVRLFATQSISDSEYLAAIDELRKKYPDDGMIDLISIDAYVLRNAYDKSLESIEHLDKTVGGDPYLKILRANVLEREKKLDAARDLVQSALADEPTLLRGYYAMIDISLARHDPAETLKWMKNAEAQGVKFGDLKAVSAFAEFVKSPQYKTWLKSHGKTE